TGGPVGPPLPAGHFPEDARFSPNGPLLLTRSAGGSVRLWAVGAGKGGEVLDPEYPVGAAAFRPDGQTLLVRGGDPALAGPRAVGRRGDTASGPGPVLLAPHGGGGGGFRPGRQPLRDRKRVCPFSAPPGRRRGPALGYGDAETGRGKARASQRGAGCGGQPRR